MSDSSRIAQSFSDLAKTVHALRAPGGCPWDIAQTHQSLRPFLIEEAYEVLDVLDQIHTDADLQRPSVQAAFKEELGDLLMQVMLHAEMTDQAGAFSVADVADGLNTKLIRRHPHVFGKDRVESADAALASWDAQKARERQGKTTTDASADPSVLSGLPRALPALQKTTKTIERVSKVGFQWPDLAGPLSKVDEELAELKAELEAGKMDPNGARARIEAELGDLLFSVCNVAHFAKVSPEEALRGTLARFESRFRYVEDKLRERGKKPGDSTLEEMDILWNEAKARTK